MNQPIMKIFGLFKSLKFTAVLIGLLGGIYFLSLVIPQKWMFERQENYGGWVEEDWMHRLLDAVKFTEIYLSPITIALLACFFVNLIVVVTLRAPIILNRLSLSKASPGLMNAASVASGLFQ